MTQDQIERLLEQVGEAMSRGDPQAVSRCWAVPALVLSDDGALAVSSTDEIEAFFSQAIQWYRSQGLMSTRPSIERVDVLGDMVASVDVRWPTYNASGEEKASERSHYIVQLGNDGRARIRVALTRTA